MLYMYKQEFCCAIFKATIYMISESNDFLRKIFQKKTKPLNFNYIFIQMINSNVLHLYVFTLIRFLMEYKRNEHGKKIVVFFSSSIKNIPNS